MFTIKKGLLVGAATAATAVGAMAFSAAPAFAGTITNTSPITVPNLPNGEIGTTSVTVTGFTPGVTVYGMTCDGASPTSPTYNLALDCDTGTTSVATTNAEGDATFSATSTSGQPIFTHGQSVDDLFNCLASNDSIAAGTTENGVYPIDSTVPSWGGSSGNANCQFRVGLNPDSYQSTDAYIPFVVTNTPGPAVTLEFNSGATPTDTENETVGTLANSWSYIAAGGDSNYTYSYTGNLPPGDTLKVNSTGQYAFSGIPTTAGTYSFTVDAVDGAGDTGSEAVTIVVSPKTVTPPPATPEAPLAVLLPLGGAGLLGAGTFFMTRRRRSTSAAS